MDLGVFGPQSEDEKQESFEASSIKFVLKQLGYTPGLINILDREVGGFTWEWFNSEVSLPFTVGSCRLFKYNLLDIFNGKRHPLIDAFLDQREEELCHALVFKLESTRWIVTDYQKAYQEQRTHICVRRQDCTLYVQPCAGFFEPWKASDE